MFYTQKVGVQTAEPVEYGVRKKMSIKSRLRNWLLGDDADVPVAKSLYEDRLGSNGLNFKLYKASGGYIVECRNYDIRTDKHVGGLYVINNEQELGKEFEKIITMECLKL